VVDVTLAEIVVDQLVFVLGAPEDVLDQDSAVDLLEGVMTSLAQLPVAELQPVRAAAESRLAGGQQPPEAEDALRELVLLLEEIDAA
jgi:hypothetical protein